MTAPRCSAISHAMATRSSASSKRSTRYLESIAKASIMGNNMGEADPITDARLAGPSAARTTSVPSAWPAIPATAPQAMSTSVRSADGTWALSSRSRAAQGAAAAGANDFAHPCHRFSEHPDQLLAALGGPDGFCPVHGFVVIDAERDPGPHHQGV